MASKNWKNVAKAKAIEKSNEKRWLALNPGITNESGIYFLTREDELGIKFSYVGQAKHTLSRLCQHLVGYQHIDLSLKKHGLYSEDNPNGWKVGVKYFPESKLDEMERHFITLYAKNGYQSRNKDTGGGAGKTEVGERKPAKGYYDGIQQGKKSLARELSHIIEKHLKIEIRADKQGNKVSMKAFDKFNDLLNEENYERK